MYQPLREMGKRVAGGAGPSVLRIPISVHLHVLRFSSVISHHTLTLLPPRSGYRLGGLHVLKHVQQGWDASHHSPLFLVREKQLLLLLLLSLAAPPQSDKG